ncbi:negative cofactor 2 transcription regulator complex subunit ncb2 [Ciborinia camelliae]|nr:negative cofactor 2 transcription regulator complex subunit ncb2 [Ciborinia camelliae]
MDNDCGCSSRARGLSKAPILTGDHNIFWDSMPSASSCKKCTEGQITDCISALKRSKSSTTLKASSFQFKRSDHYYGDLDSTHIPSSFLYHPSPYLYKKYNLSAKAAAPIPNRTSSLAFKSQSKKLKKMSSGQQFLSALSKASGSPEALSSLSLRRKHLEHVQKVLEDIRTWHKEVSILISRSHPETPKDCHQTNVNVIKFEDSHQRQTRYLESTFMDSLQQNAPWAQAFNGAYTAPRRYTSRPPCPGSNISPAWKIDPVPSSIYKAKPIPNTGNRRSSRPIPSPRASSLGATIVPRRRNAVRGRILPKPVSIVCPTLKRQHSYEARLTGKGSHGSTIFDDNFGCHSDLKSTLTGREEKIKIDTLHSSAAVFSQTELFAGSQHKPFQVPKSSIHEDGLPHSGTVIRLSARHSSLQASEPTSESPPLQDEEEEERSRYHIAFVHSALRNLVPFEVSEYLYRISQSPETSNDSEEAFLDNFAVTTPPSTVQKIVTEILPASSGLAFGKDARDLLIECCVEFITLISSEANEISEKESKKTIACEHITKALEQLGFGEYVKDIVEVASEHKEQLKGREKKANKLEQSGLTPEQLLAMQEEAFRDAAQRHG